MSTSCFIVSSSFYSVVLICSFYVGVDFLLFNLLKGFLDNQFTQLEELEDESNPDFVVEIVSVFFDDSERILNDLSLAL